MKKLTAVSLKPLWNAAKCSTISESIFTFLLKQVLPEAVWIEQTKGIGQMKGILRAIGYFILYFLLTILFQFILSMGFMAVAAARGLRDEKLIIEFVNNNLLGMTVISGILTIVVLFLIFKIRKKDVKQEWKLNKFKMKNILPASLISFSASILFSLFTYQFPPMENSIMISKSVGYYSGLCPMLGFVLMALNLLLIAPVAEEIALRGIVYTRVDKTTNSITAIAVSSVLFGLMHIAAGGIVLVIGAMLMAAVFGYIFYKFDSLWICIIAHAAANLPEFILYGHPAISDNMLWGLKVFFACAFAVGIYGINKTKIYET